jgi:hypothetical protein
VGKKIIPEEADDGIDFDKVTEPKHIYEWMGFEAYDLVFDFLDRAVKDKKIEVDVFTYDFNEPDILDRFEKLGKRLRIIIDDSTKKNKKTGKLEGHGTPPSAESQAASLKASGAQAAHTSAACTARSHRQAQRQGGARSLRLDQPRSAVSTSGQQRAGLRPT